MTFWYRSGVAYSYHCSLRLFDLQDAKKIIFFLHCFAILLYEGTFKSFFNDKKDIKNSKNSRNKDFSYSFGFMMKGSGSVQHMTNPDPDHNTAWLYQYPGMVRVLVYVLSILFFPKLQVPATKLAALQKVLQSEFLNAVREASTFCFSKHSLIKDNELCEEFFFNLCTVL